MDISNRALDVLVERILSALENKYRKIQYDKTFPTIIYGKNKDGTYRIPRENYMYNVPNGLGIDLSIGQKVWVTMPCNSFKDMYISAVRHK